MKWILRFNEIIITTDLKFINDNSVTIIDKYTSFSTLCVDACACAYMHLRWLKLESIKKWCGIPKNPRKSLRRSPDTQTYSTEHWSEHWLYPGNIRVIRKHSTSAAVTRTLCIRFPSLTTIWISTIWIRWLEKIFLFNLSDTLITFFQSSGGNLWFEICLKTYSVF